MPQPHGGDRSKAVQLRRTYPFAAEFGDKHLDRSSQDVGHDMRRERVTIVGRIAPSNPRGIDGQDEIPSRRQVPSHAEGVVLTLDIEVEVLTVDAATGDAHPE